MFTHILLVFFYFCNVDPWYVFLYSYSRQLSVPAAVDVAKVLEHQPKPGAQPAVQRARSAQVVETRDHGRGHTVRAQGGPVVVPGRAQVRHTVPNVRAIRQSCP